MTFGDVVIIGTVYFTMARCGWFGTSKIQLNNTDLLKHHSFSRYNYFLTDNITFFTEKEKTNTFKSMWFIRPVDVYVNGKLLKI